MSHYGKILIVDDEHLSAMVMDIFLRERGYDVRMASTAEEALRIAETFTPDLLLTDYLLGDGMTGVELAASLEPRNPELETFVLTGLPPEELEEATGHLARGRLFVKPVDLDVLHDAIVSVVHSRAQT